MRKIKKIFATLAVSAVALALAACVKPDVENTYEPESVIAVITSENGEAIVKTSEEESEAEEVETMKWMIECIQETDIVLTEHVGDLSRSSFEQNYDAEKQIYDQDTAWLREADLLIAECTNPSLGVGYELAYAERFNVPCYVFYRNKDIHLSAMIKGDSYYTIIPYETKEEVFAKIREILKK